MKNALRNWWVAHSTKSKRSSYFMNAIADGWKVQIPNYRTGLVDLRGDSAHKSHLIAFIVSNHFPQLMFFQSWQFMTPFLCFYDKCLVTKKIKISKKGLKISITKWSKQNTSRVGRSKSRREKQCERQCKFAKVSDSMRI